MWENRSKTESLRKRLILDESFRLLGPIIDRSWEKLGAREKIGEGRETNYLKGQKVCGDERGITGKNRKAYAGLVRENHDSNILPGVYQNIALLARETHTKEKQVTRNGQVKTVLDGDRT